MRISAEECFRTRALASPDHILVATDLTDGEYLLPHAVAQASVSGAHLTLVHAILPDQLPPAASGAVLPLTEAQANRDARLMMVAMQRKIGSLGISCSAMVRKGSAPEVIRAEIQRTGATRLILGTHGRGKLAQIALGSVANDLLTSTFIPTFVVGPLARTRRNESTPRRILHPVSLHGDYRKSVRFAIDVAQTHHAELTLLHVLDDTVKHGLNPARTLGSAKDALTALLPREMDLMPPIRTCTVLGNMVEEVLLTASTTKADWIIVGVDEDLSLWPHRDSLAYKVVTRASCPVLTIHRWESHQPAPDREAEDLSYAEWG